MSQAATSIEHVKQSTRGMKAARVMADNAARLTIKRLEKELEEALDGETLRGLPDLGGRVFGLRVEVEGSTFARLPRNRRVLILDVRGQLRAATLFPEGVYVEPPDEEEVVASVLEPFLRAVQRGMTLHSQSANKRAEAFIKIAALADKLASALR